MLAPPMAAIPPRNSVLTLVQFRCSDLWTSSHSKKIYKPKAEGLEQRAFAKLLHVLIASWLTDCGRSRANKHQRCQHPQPRIYSTARPTVVGFAAVAFAIVAGRGVKTARFFRRAPSSAYRRKFIAASVYARDYGRTCIEYRGTE